MTAKPIVKKERKLSKKEYSALSYDEQRLYAIRQSTLPEYYKKACLSSPDIVQFDELFGDMLTSWLIYRIGVKRDRLLGRELAYAVRHR